jgi:hypothetical protein
MPLPNKCQRHGMPACSRCIVAGDEGKRMSDLINAMVTFKGWDELQNGYLAFRLADGSSDGTLYDTYEAALKHTDEYQCCYFCFRQAMGGANAKDCQIFLEFNRYVVAAGVPRKHPESGRGVSPILSAKGYERFDGRWR